MGNTSDRVTVSIGDGNGKWTDPIPLDTFTQNLDKKVEWIRRKGGGMKQDADFQRHNDQALSVAAEELRQFIERFEQLAAEKQDIADQQKEVMAEAKGRGYDTRVMRKIIALRRRKPDDIAEEEAILDLYKSALGMG